MTFIELALGIFLIAASVTLVALIGFFISEIRRIGRGE